MTSFRHQAVQRQATGMYWRQWNRMPWWKTRVGGTTYKSNILLMLHVLLIQPDALHSVAARGRRPASARPRNPRQWNDARAEFSRV